MFNINFDYTFNLIIKRGVVKQITETIPEIKDFEAIKEKILNYIDSKEQQ